MTCRPFSLTASASFISVPLPATFVAIVMRPSSPAVPIISDSFSGSVWAFRTRTSASSVSPSLINFLSNLSLSSLHSSMEPVHIRTGLLFLRDLIISLTTALNLLFLVRYINPGLSFLITGLLVGIETTSRP